MDISPLWHNDVVVSLYASFLKHDTAINITNGQPSHSMAGVVENRERRETALRYVSYRLYGFLSKANRTKMPRCIDEGVRALFPAYNGLHVGNQTMNGWPLIWWSMCVQRI